MEAYRNELLVYCYRLTGSADEAEDLVQETYLRAWRAREGFEGRASQRTYLYRIATNACLTALRKRPRVALQPLPDERWQLDPAQARADVKLAFIVALQHLSPVRRAVLILRDVLEWPAAEVAAALGTTTAAVNSALLRARARIAAAAPDIHDVPDRPSRVLDAYVEAFHDADIAKLVQLFREDIALEMPPQRLITGSTRVAAFLGAHVLTRAGAFRLVRAGANTQPAFAAYQDGLPHAIHVLDFRGQGLSRITVFHDARVLALFEEPRVHRLA